MYSFVVDFVSKCTYLVCQRVGTYYNSMCLKNKITSEFSFILINICIPEWNRCLFWLRWQHFCFRTHVFTCFWVDLNMVQQRPSKRILLSSLSAPWIFFPISLFSSSFLLCQRRSFSVFNVIITSIVLYIWLFAKFETDVTCDRHSYIRKRIANRKLKINITHIIYTYIHIVHKKIQMK